jgi:Cation transport ATPase
MSRARPISSWPSPPAPSGRISASCPSRGDGRDKYNAQNESLGQQGLRVLATARKDFDPKPFDPNADLLPLITD